MLSEQQLARFERDGFLCVEQVLDHHALAPIRAEYAALVDALGRRHGVADGDWAELGFEGRVSRLLARHPAAYEHLDISLPMTEALGIDAGVHTGEAVFGLLSHPALLSIARSVIGAEIYSNPVQHVRIKPPERLLDVAGRGNSNMARTYWHQDAAVVLEEADQTPILTVWVAISDASEAMGCLSAVPGSHRWPGLGPHCPGRTGVGEIFIPEALLIEHPTVTLAVRAGAVVLLHRNTWHGAGPNRSERVRWSFDLRYQPPGLPTGRDVFPGFLAASARDPGAVMRDPAAWAASWARARSEIASGARRARFNPRWEARRGDPLCA